MAVVQTRCFQVVVEDTRLIHQAMVDAARASLQSQVNTFLATLAPQDVRDVVMTTDPIAKYGDALVFTAHVTYWQH